MSQPGTQGADYGFSAQPHVVRAKKKYRTSDGQPFDQEVYRYQNLMFEKRVVRGNTYSQYMVANSEVEEAPIQNNRRNKRQLIRRNTHQSFEETGEIGSEDYNFRGMVLQPPSGCRFAESYTDETVEFETDLPPCHDATTQTEWVIEKKIPDLSMPVYNGVDKETQIYPSDNLFDFDYESEPIVQVLVTRCLEESRIEVCEEQELQALKDRQTFLKKRAAEESESLLALQQREQTKHREHEEFMKRKRRQKEDLIDVHQHMVSRVYSKRFVADIANSAFEILDNMCMFMDEKEKEIKDNFMPWLYEETLEIAKSHQTQKKNTEKMIDEIEAGIISAHKKTVSDEIERRRLAKEEEDRLAKEKAEAKAAKLAWKVQRRVDRRLFHLQNEIMDSFVNKGDDDQDIVNISDFDGTDADGSKTIGFRGGVIGEFYKLIKQLKNNEKFASVDFENEELIQDLFADIFRDFVPDGWTMMIGLKPEFETNYAHQMGEFQISELTPNFVKDQEYEEDYDLTVEYVLKHYFSSYDFQQIPELKELQERQLAKLRPPPEKEEEPEGEEEEQNGEEEGEEENEEEAKHDDEGEEGDNEEEAEEEEEVDEMEGVSDLVKEYKFIVNAVLTKILDKNSSLNNVKFNLIQEFQEPSTEEGQEGSEDDEGEEEEASNIKPLALCVFLPEPIPEETEDEEHEEAEEEHEQEEHEEEEEVSLSIIKFKGNLIIFYRKNKKKNI